MPSMWLGQCTDQLQSRLHSSDACLHSPHSYMQVYDLDPEKDRNIQLPPTSEIPWHSSQITMRFFRGRFFLEFNTEMLQKIGLSDHLSSLLCAALIAAMAIADSVLSYAAMQVAHATAVAGRLSATDSGPAVPAESAGRLAQLATPPEIVTRSLLEQLSSFSWFIVLRP